MNQCLISLGANLGNPRETMRRAAKEIIEATNARAVRASQLYRTPPIGGPTGQGDFLNAVLAIETALNMHELPAVLHAVEAKLGRHRQMRWEARPIDLDILLFSDQRLWSPDLKIPHPRMAFRSFVIKPAAEIVPQWRDPVSQMSIGELSLVLDQARSLVVLTSNSVDWLSSLIPSIAETDDCVNQDVQILKYAEDVSIAVMPPVTSASASNSLNICLEAASRKSAELGIPISGLLVSLSEENSKAMTDAKSSMQWEAALNLTSDADNAIRFQGPRYLIAPCNKEWAVHEIRASMDAMKSFVEPTGEALI
jgi:2-amino-4-hydroxy-6-hydroxymethyldihydropteridine diphosphokinase